MANFSRRSILRGAVNGAAVSVALPLLDYFFDNNGEALAAGVPVPKRFGVWFWGCGVNEARWVPDKTGFDYDIKAELAPIAPLKDKVTVLSGFNCVLGGRANRAHWSGVMATLSGSAPTQGGMDGGATDYPTIDMLVSDAISAGTRFRSLEVACTGNSGVSYSMRAGSTVNPSEVDPVSLYRRLFGADFQDPNGKNFKPDPAIMLRQSVLSSVKDDRDALLKKLGASDRARLDEYFTTVRQNEEQLSQLLEKPASAEACVLPKAPKEVALGPTWEVVVKTHDLLTDLVVMALACNQTRVFNVALSTAASNLRKADSPMSFHQLTHEEPVDKTLGYQPQSTYYMEKSIGAFGTLIQKMAAVKEGNGTLLDNSLVLATSESNFAKLHTIENLPILVAGTAGGKWKSGQHIAGKGDPSSRVGLTIQQALGMPVESWGSDAMKTSKSISEVVV